ncbi:ABC transporter permease [Butyrivibrio sp. MC2013]|uniref:ABC transporter permease n=1 Tax=Butyrivibrio sp. MC2013 TaxID=1280686 RepID=UPI0004216B19|nr:ABC transporter permease [Butyrivibrio sp. MC2013]
MNKIIHTYQKYSFLFEELVKRDFKQKYKRSILGMGWSILSPLLTLLVMYMVFSNLFGGRMEHYVIYLFSGQLVLSYYKESTKNGMTSLLNNSKIFSKINVPKYMFLFSKNVSALVNFGLTLGVYFIFCIFDGIGFHPRQFMLVFPILCLLGLNIGVGLILSALFVFFRDIRYLYDVLLTLLTYVSAIFYTVDRFSPLGQRLFLLNPVYVYIKYFRCIMIDELIPSPEYHLLCIFYAGISLLIGGWIYKKYNHAFLYYL